MGDGDRGHDALDHLQVAALELIAAFRAVLDVAEEAVREPQALRDLIATTARAATHAAGQAAGQASGQATGQAATEAEHPSGGVEHISIT
jgi:hypothetical protein